MKLKRKELNRLIEGVDLYDKQKLQFFRLTLLLTENKKLINTEVDVFEEAKKKLLPDDEIAEYRKKTQELAQSYWMKDDKAEYVMEEVNGQSVHKLTNRLELDGKLEILNERYKKVFDRYNEGIKQAEEFLEEEIEIPLKKITDVEWVKKLSPKTLSALAPIIECTIPEKILEEKGDALKTEDIIRIYEWCKVVEVPAPVKEVKEEVKEKE